MRKIAFRAWDKLNNQMVEVLQIKTAGEEYAYEPFLQKDYIYGRKRTENFTIGKSDCELMQFTGLLDKNGKEIYEGDIVSEVGLLTNYEVKWSDGGFIYGYEDLTAGAVENDNLEVVGNIYENPELLK